MKNKKRVLHDRQDLLESINNIPESMDEPLVKLMTSEMAENVASEWDDALVKLDTLSLER